MGPDIPRLFLFGGLCWSPIRPKHRARLALRILGCLAIVPAAWHRVPGVRSRVDVCWTDGRVVPVEWYYWWVQKSKGCTKKLVDNGRNYQPQLVQESFHQQKFFMGCIQQFTEIVDGLIKVKPFWLSFSALLNRGSVEDDPSLYKESMVMQELILCMNLQARRHGFIDSSISLPFWSMGIAFEI